MTSMSIQNNKPGIRFVGSLGLRQVDSLKPLDSNVVVRLSIWRSYIVPISYFPEFLQKPLLLNLLGLKYGARRQSMAVHNDSLNK